MPVKVTYNSMFGRTREKSHTRVPDAGDASPMFPLSAVIVGLTAEKDRIIAKIVATTLHKQALCTITKELVGKRKSSTANRIKHKCDLDNG